MKDELTYTVNEPTDSSMTTYENEEIIFTYRNLPEQLEEQLHNVLDEVAQALRMNGKQLDNLADGHADNVIPQRIELWNDLLRTAVEVDQFRSGVEHEIALDYEHGEVVIHEKARKEVHEPQ